MKIDKLYFATSNRDKLKEARILLGIEVLGTELKVDEIQSLDPKDVAEKKAQSYFSILKKPIFVEDTSLSIKALNGLPGTYIDAFMKVLGNEGLVKLLKDSKERGAVAQATVVFVDSQGELHTFIGKTYGNISAKPKGVGFGWDPIFIPEGESRTFGEMTLDEKNKYSMRAAALKIFKKWLDKS